jgi:hypothetical protein
VLSEGQQRRGASTQRSGYNAAPLALAVAASIMLN